MPLTGDGQVNKKAFRIAINSRQLARFHPLDREKTANFFVRVRRETGKKSVVRVHHGEGVAIHIDPESCADAREGIGEALTGERIGQAIEP